MHCVAQNWTAARQAVNEPLAYYTIKLKSNGRLIGIQDAERYNHSSPLIAAPPAYLTNMQRPAEQVFIIEKSVPALPDSALVNNSEVMLK